MTSWGVRHVTLLILSVHFHSHQRISICPCNCLSGGSICCDTSLLRGLCHHLRLWHTEERTTRRGLEVGWLQWGCGVRQHGITRVCWCSWESARRSLCYESSQQWSWTCGEYFFPGYAGLILTKPYRKDHNAFPLWFRLVFRLVYSACWWVSLCSG